MTTRKTTKPTTPRKTTPRKSKITPIPSEPELKPVNPPETDATTTAQPASGCSEPEPDWDRIDTPEDRAEQAQAEADAEAVEREIADEQAAISDRVEQASPAMRAMFHGATKVGFAMVNNTIVRRRVGQPLKALDIDGYKVGEGAEKVDLGRAASDQMYDRLCEHEWFRSAFGDETKFMARYGAVLALFGMMSLAAQDEIAAIRASRAQPVKEEGQADAA